jgi:NADH:ubiquinone reductase (non-electrogenic)
MILGQSTRVVLTRSLIKKANLPRLSGGVHYQIFVGGARRQLHTRGKQNVQVEVADERKKMVILGSGWAACNTIQSLGAAALRQYDITVVSPNNYYVYTPMLPSVSVGTLEPRSIMEPVRNFISQQVRKVPEASIVFSEAEATSVDIETKKIKCLDTSPRTPVTMQAAETKPKKWKSSLDGAFFANEKSPDGSFFEHEFELPYDVLVLGVGATTNTFGTPGAMDHCLFLKSVSDALQIRSAVIDCFETATVASVANEDKSQIDRMLSFVVVGAGPTGVEVAAELRDFIKDNLSKTYPHFKDQKIKVSIVEMGDKVLNTYDKAISEYAQNRFKREDIDVLTKHQVKQVNESSIEILDLENKETKVLPFGLCIWASGVRPVDVSLNLAKDLGTRMLETDSWLRVRGAEGSIFALGDCAKITTPSMKTAAQELFDKADRNKDGEVSLEEFTNMMELARDDYPHMEAYLGNVSQRSLQSLYASTAKEGKAGGITQEAFEAALTEIDKEIKMLPPTAQVAAQQGTYLGKLFTEVPYDKLAHKEGFETSFKYDHQGSMAYVGGERAVIDSPLIGVWKGLITAVMWKGAYWGKSVSMRCKVLMAFDWAKTYLIGRDTSRLGY